VCTKTGYDGEEIHQSKPTNHSLEGEVDGGATEVDEAVVGVASAAHGLGVAVDEL
jgi:hypothetical protein